MSKREPWQSQADADASDGLTYIFWMFVLLCASPFIGYAVKWLMSFIWK